MYVLYGTVCQFDQIFSNSDHELGQKYQNKTGRLYLWWSNFKKYWSFIKSTCSSFIEIAIYTCIYIVILICLIHQYFIVCVLLLAMSRSKYLNEKIKTISDYIKESFMLTIINHRRVSLAFSGPPPPPPPPEPVLHAATAVNFVIQIMAQSTKRNLRR